MVFGVRRRLFDIPPAAVLALAGCSGVLPAGGSGATSFLGEDDTAAEAPAPAADAPPPPRSIAPLAEPLVRELEGLAAVAAGGKRSRIVLDASDLSVEGRSHLNRPLLAERLRVELNRAAHGRLRFVAGPPAAGDSRVKPDGGLRLRGRVSLRDTFKPETGATASARAIAFDLVDPATDDVVWSGTYDLPEDP